MTAGFTPIPYKLITLSSGAADIPFALFIGASIISRGARFYLVAGLLAFFGERAAIWIDRNFNRLTLVFVLLVLVFTIISTM